MGMLITGLLVIVKNFRRAKAAEDVETKGFDGFDIRLGDLMRGERATMGKSLLDVQRELKIKAAYIAAIENSDPSAFNTPGFIAGYVRSYARYLSMDPDWAFDTFCRESGFTTAHGMSAAASSAKPVRPNFSASGLGKDIFSSSATPFIPSGGSLLSRIESSAIGSIIILISLIVGLGFGGLTVLREVQKVKFAPVEQTPVVVSELDPLAGATIMSGQTNKLAQFDTPSSEALDRLYRPQALEVPVLVARDGPISTLNPGFFGTPASALNVGISISEVAVVDDVPAVRVNEDPILNVKLIAARPAWVRVRAADGLVIFEGIMDAGDQFSLPQTEEPAILRVGESGALYFEVNGIHFGPAGPNGKVTSDLYLSAENLMATYAVADLTADQDLAEAVSLFAQAAIE